MPDQSLERASLAVAELSASVREFTAEVQRDEELRTRKIKAIQQVLSILVPCVMLLVVLAITNFVVLSRVRAAAEDARSTNDLLVSCFQPASQCSTASDQRSAQAITQIRQTQFVIAICQRQNPVTEDPNGTAVVKCVQSYYPSFSLPQRVAVAPK